LATDQLRDPAVAVAAARVLLRDDTPEVRALVSARLDQPGLESEQRSALAGMVLEALLSANDPSAEVFAARLSRDADPALRSLMTQRIMRLGPDAMERLCQPLVQDADPSVQEAARGALRMATAERAAVRARGARARR
jgi:hypothetical protein